MGRADSYSQPDAPDPVLPAGLVLELAGVHAPWVSRVLAVDESGGEARVYVLDGGVVVKTQRPHRLRPRTSLAKETRLMEALSEVEGVKVPRLFGYRVVDTELGLVELIAMSQIPGTATRHVRVTGAGRTQLLGDVAWMLRTVHGLDVEALGSTGQFPGADDAAGLRRRLESGFADLLDALAERPQETTLRRRPDEIAAAAVASLPTALVAPTVALHSNAGPTHVFVDSLGAFTGLIDFGDSCLSHPALDLRAWPDPADRIALRGAYLDGTTPDTEFDAVWTVAMMYADLAALVSRPEFAGRAVADLELRLASL